MNKVIDRIFQGRSRTRAFYDSVREWLLNEDTPQKDFEWHGRGAITVTRKIQSFCGEEMHIASCLGFLSETSVVRKRKDT